MNTLTLVSLVAEEPVRSLYQVDSDVSGALLGEILYAAFEVAYQSAQLTEDVPPQLRELKSLAKVGGALGGRVPGGGIENFRVVGHRLNAPLYLLVDYMGAVTGGGRIDP